MWQLDGAELHLSISSDEVCLILGVLGESVVSLSDSGRIRISHPVYGTQLTVKTQLEISARHQTVINCVTLPKHEKVFVVYKEGFLHQVCHTLTLYL